MSSTPQTVLIVDDLEETRYTIGRYLQQEGFLVREAATGREGLRLAQERPDLIILDVRLPDISGFEVSQALRGSPETARIPILQVSAAFTRAADKAEGLEGGADSYLVLPVERKELVATVRALLRLSRAESEARRLAGQWQDTFDAVNHAICIVGPDGKVERHNRGFVAFLGAVENQITRRPFDECLRIAGVNNSALFKAPFSPYPVDEEVLIGMNTFRISVSPFSTDPAKPAGAICIFWDVSPYISYERRLLQENERLAAEVERLGPSA